MIGSPARWPVIALALVLMAASASKIARTSRANSTRAIAEGLRDELVSLRAEVDACLGTRDQSELRFQSLTRETAALRMELDSLEALDPRGVPTESYELYMGHVEAYNASISEWEAQAEDLSELALRCDSLVREHNMRAESLQEFLVSEGIWGPDRIVSGDDPIDSS